MDIDEEVIAQYFWENDNNIRSIVASLQKLDSAIAHLGERMNEMNKNFIEFQKAKENNNE